MVSGCLQDKINKFFVAGTYTRVIDVQKDQCCFEAYTFVPIDERMIHHQMIKISGSHFKNVCVQILASKACLGLSDGGFKQPDISDTVTAAVGIDLILMRFKNVI